MKNIIMPSLYSLKTKTFSNGLSHYDQTYCVNTLTDDGFRIYRKPDNTYSSSNRTMWGGMILHPFTDDSEALITGHSYCLLIDVTGQSSNSNEYYWSNNAGWGGGSYGLGTSPTIISNNMSIGTNFSGTKRMYYAFTVSDEVYKTCTTSYSSFVAGTSYNTYRDFKWGFGYTSTGTLGTDVYLSNIRLFDITSIPVSKILKNGILDTGAVIGYGENNFDFHAYGETQCNDLDEI